MINLKLFRISIFETAFIFLLLSFFIPNLSSAQTKFIAESEQNISQLDGSLIEKFNQQASIPGTESSTLINISRFLESQEEGIIEIDIPGQRCSQMSFLVEDADYRSATDYYWRGLLLREIGSCESGTMTISKNGDALTGFLTVEDDSYVFQNINDHLGVLTKYIKDDTIYDEDEHDCSVHVVDDPNAVVAGPRDAECFLRVQVVYDPDNITEDSQEMVENTAKMLVAQTNTTLNNSKLFDFKVVLAGVDQVDAIDFEDNNPIESILNEMNFPANTIEGVPTNLFEELEVLRMQNSADITVFLYRPDRERKRFKGVATGINITPEKANAVVHYTATAVSHYTFPHEIMHLMGCKHNGDAGTTNYSFPHKIQDGFFGWTIPNKRTIMHSGGTHRVGYFSNPDVEYYGNPTGTATKDNARRIEDEFCNVSDFGLDFEEPVEFRILSLNAPTRYCISDNIIASVTTSATGPVTYYWYKSTDGVNYESTGGNSSSMSIYGSDSPQLYLKIIVMDENNVTDWALVKLTLKQPNDSDYDCAFGPGKLSNIKELFPNPVADVLYIPQTDDLEPKDAQANYMIYNVLGQQMKIVEGDVRNYEKYIELNVHSLSPGTYFLNVQNKATGKSYTYEFQKL